MVDKQDKGNKRSILLSNDENEIIISMLGHKCQTLATAVVQLMVALPESRDRWTKKTTGIACFVKDNPKRSYFIRIYDLMVGCMSWEQELYTRFKYNDVRPFFHTFAAQKYNAGLNFASEEEAKIFKHQILGMLRRSEAKRKKKEEDRKNQRNAQKAQPSSFGNGDSIDSGHGRPHNEHRGKHKRKKKITKDDIGEPANFKHIEHIGWNPEAGFNVNVDMQDDKWKTLFNVIGVTEQQMKEKSTREFIYDFVQKAGGIEEVNKKIEQETGPQGPPPPPPSRGPPLGAPPPPPRGYAPPPPPPARMGQAPPPPPHRGARPPPPPPARGPLMSGPPPPPPPPPSIGAPPPPPPIGGGMSGAPPPPPPIGGRGDLLSQIQQGKPLKTVSEDDKRKSVVGDRSDLLSEIQKGTTLKKVTQEDGPKHVDQAGGILGALQSALAKRDNAIHSSDDDSDSETEYDSDDDEWND